MARPHKTKTFLSLCNDCPSMSEFGQQLKLSSNLHTSTVAHTHEHTVVKLNLAGLLRITLGKDQSLSLVEFIFTDPHTCQVRSLLWRDDNAFPGLRSTGSPIPSIYLFLFIFALLGWCDPTGTPAWTPISSKGIRAMLGVQRRLLDLLRALFLLRIPLGKARLRTRKGRNAFVNNNN